jgi:hypothetical protein
MNKRQNSKNNIKITDKIKYLKKNKYFGNHE